MAFEDGGHIWRAVYQADAPDGNTIVNTLHYNHNHSTASEAPSGQDLANRLRDDTLTLWRALFPTSYVIQPIVVTDARDPSNPQQILDQWTAGPGGPGTMSPFANAQLLPVQMCGLAKLITGNVGRSFRGRIFLPPIWDDAEVEGGQIKVAGSYYNKCATWLNAIPHQPDLVTGGSDDTVRWCVYSRTRRAALKGNYAMAVETYSFPLTVHWLRSRGT